MTYQKITQDKNRDRSVENKQSNSANTFQLFDNREEVSQLRNLQDLINGSNDQSPLRSAEGNGLHSNEAPIQGFFKVGNNRISENMNVVHEGQKDVYATSNKIVESNTALDIADGKYQLHKGDVKNYGGNTNYYKIEPRLNPRTTTEEEQSLQPTMGDDDEMLKIKHEGYMNELKWVEEDLDEFRKEFANDISKDPDWEKENQRKNIIAKQLLKWCHAEPYRHDLLFTELAQATLNYENHKSLKTLTLDIFKVQAKFHKFVQIEDQFPRAISLPNDCAQCVSELVGGQNARERGNDNPDVGGNYHTGLTSPKKNQIGWNFHWAGVIMKDGGDNVTMESAGGMSMTNQDRQTWWFGMYGTKKDEQTFKHQITEFHYKRNIELLTKELPDGIENWTFGEHWGIILDIAQMRKALKALNGD